jgi:hypothetical protein
MARAISRTGLIKNVDRAFSRMVRQAHANSGGWVECVTCGLSMPWEYSQCGHFVKRGHHSVRWDERNCAPQCPRCNLYLDGAQDEFAAYIVRKYGQGTLEDLLRLKRTAKRWTLAELREMLERFGG